MKDKKEKLKQEIERLTPFHHKIDLPYNLNTHSTKPHRANESTRLTNLVKHVFPTLIATCGSFKDKRILDIGCNCGGFSVEAAKLGCRYILGIDTVKKYIEQANFIKNALQLNQTEFKLKSIDDLNESADGLFDITLCFGILYHLENPVSSMKNLASITKNIMVVDTNVLPLSIWNRSFLKKSMWMMNFPLVSTSKSEDISTSLWRNSKQVVQFLPTERAVVDLLKFLGFSKVVKINPLQKGLEKRYYNGKRATFLAIRS